MQRPLIHGLAAASMFAIAASLHANTYVFPVSMTGPMEVPTPGDPDGTASGTVTIDTGSNTVSWNLTYANIDPPTLMHIHTGGVGVPGGIVVDMGVVTTGGPGTLINSTTAAAGVIASILSNTTGFYVNIHNGPFPAGAVRGQLPRVFNLCMNGANEAPGPGDADGCGSGWIAFQEGLNRVSWNFTYTNINPPTAMHVHTGNAGVPGPILVDMGVVTTGGPGTLINSTTTSGANMAAILANPAGYYVNIHNADFPPGAIRAQLPFGPPSASIDGDCRVGAADLGMLLGSWGPCQPGRCRADLNGDNTVNAADLGILLGAWGGNCP